MIAFWGDFVTWGDLVWLVGGYGIGKAVGSYVIWKKYYNG
jgi:hypothetical protein